MIIIFYAMYELTRVPILGGPDHFFPPFGAHAFYSPRIVVGTLFDYISVTSVLKYTKLLDLRSQTGSGNLARCVFLVVNGDLFSLRHSTTRGPR